MVFGTLVTGDNNGDVISHSEAKSFIKHCTSITHVWSWWLICFNVLLLLSYSICFVGNYFLYFFFLNFFFFFWQSLVASSCVHLGRLPALWILVVSFVGCLRSWLLCLSAAFIVNIYPLTCFISLHLRLEIKIYTQGQFWGFSGYKVRMSKMCSTLAGFEKVKIP